VNSPLRELNPDVVFQILLRRWDILVLLPVLAVVGAVAAYKILPARYEASARLLIQDQQTVNPFRDGMVEEWSAERRMPLVESIFRAHSTSEQVLRRLGRLGPNADPVEVNEAVTAFQNDFEVIALGGELVLVKVHGESPTEAYDGAVELVSTFTERILYPQRETMKASAVLFEEQLEHLRGGDVVPLEEQASDGTDPRSIANVRKALAEAEARLAGIEQEVERAEEKMRLVTPERDRLRESLKRARQKLASLRMRYGEGHPTLAAQQGRVRRLESVLNERDQTSQPRGQSQIEAAENAEHQARLLALKQAAAEVQLLRNRLLAQEISTFESGSQVWQVDAPVMPTLPTGLSPWLILIGAFFAGLVLALLIIAVLAALDDSIRGDSELADALEAPCLGRMPRGGV
jgi:capsular polysaccharide biosynthesis protein